MVYWHGVGLSGNSHARLCGCLSAVNINKMSADHWLTHLTVLPKIFFSQPRLSTLKKQLLHLWRQSLIQLLYMITAALTQSQMQQSSCFMWHIKRLALSLTVFISNESGECSCFLTLRSTSLWSIWRNRKQLPQQSTPKFWLLEVKTGTTFVGVFTSRSATFTIWKARRGLHFLSRSSRVRSQGAIRKQMKSTSS